MRKAFRIGQRVLASFGQGDAPALGVISSEVHGPYVSVQFQPCGAHYSCYLDRVRAYGDANGWTDAEYRIEREKSYCWERAASVEAERRERYPDKPFSMYQPAEMVAAAPYRSEETRNRYLAAAAAGLGDLPIGSYDHGHDDNEDEIARSIAAHEVACFNNPDPAYGP